MVSKTLLFCCSMGLASPTLAAAAHPALLPTNVANIFSYPAPPAGFNAFTASPLVLSDYGFPPRPAFSEGSGARRRWESLVTSTRIQPILQSTAIVNGPALRANGRLGVNSQGATQYSKNWSGQILSNNATYYGTGSFTAIAGTFNLPVASQAFGVCTGGWDYLSSWVGIDGYSSTDVFQAGIESDAYCDNGTTQPYYTAWLEWYPTNETRITNLPVAAGDVMLIWLIAQSSTTGRAIIVNQTTGQSVVMSMSAPAGTSLVGNNAEWIIERPTVNKALATLSNYVQSWMSDENATIVGNGQSGNFGTPPLGATAFLLIMNDNNGAPISYATPAGGNAAVFKDEGSVK